MNFIKKRNLPELLAPAGSFEHLKAAVAAGADAIYMGGEKFGARAYAHNFSREDMIEALQFAHFHERKLYLTVNTLMKEKELFEELGDFLFPYYENGLDGVIVQDIGAVRFIRENFPDLEIHGSTQLTVTDFRGAVAAKRMGMTRVVPARELSLAEIKRIKKETGLEVEVFVHGALCYCYSGQCLLSSMYGGRSGNRGRCAQPCRLPYTLMNADGMILNPSKYTKYLLSPKDLCSLSMLPSLMEIPVDSLKIEGRMKNVEYVAGVTAIYRKYLDKISENWEQRAQFQPEEEDIHALEELYCRGSFTEGYWNKHNGQDMMAAVSPKNTGRKVGKVLSVSKNKVRMHFEDALHPKDILVIPVSKDGQDEVILTVPSKDVGTSLKGQVTLNAPRTQSIKPGMPVYRRRNEELLTHIEKNILNGVIKYPVTGDITLKVGEPLMLQLFCREESVFVEGPVIECSERRPVTKEDILRQMHKTGNVPFTLTSFEVNLDEGCFLPMSALKRIRQDGFALLEEKLRICKNRVDNLPEKREYFYEKNLSSKELDNQQNLMNKRYDCPNQAQRELNSEQEERIASVYNIKQAFLYCEDTFFDGICLPWEFFSEKELENVGEKIKTAGKSLYLALPRVFRGNNVLEDKLKKICSLSIWDGIYAYTINEMEFLMQLEGCTTRVIAGASFYHWNSSAIQESNALYDNMTVRELPVELSEEEISDMIKGMDKEQQQTVDFELLIYGRIPVMQSAQCLKKTCGHCNKTSGRLWLEDKKKRKLLVTTHCLDCYNLIWQDKPKSLIGENIKEVSSHIKRHRFDLFELTEAEVSSVKQRYLKWKEQHFTEEQSKDISDSYWNYGIE